MKPKKENKDKWDYDNPDEPFGREEAGRTEDEESGYGRNSDKINAARKGEGLEEYSDDKSEGDEKSEWNPDDFDEEKKVDDEDEDK